MSATAPNDLCRPYSKPDFIEYQWPRIAYNSMRAKMLRYEPIPPLVRDYINEPDTLRMAFWVALCLDRKLRGIKDVAELVSDHFLNVDDSTLEVGMKDVQNTYKVRTLWERYLDPKSPYRGDTDEARREEIAAWMKQNPALVLHLNALAETLNKTSDLSKFKAAFHEMYRLSGREVELFQRPAPRAHRPYRKHLVLQLFPNGVA